MVMQQAAAMRRRVGVVHRAMRRLDAEALRFQQPRRCRENLEALRGDPGIRARQGLLNRVEALVSDYRFDEALRCLGEDA